MNQFFYSDNIFDETIILPKEEAHHALQVLRKNIGDTIISSGNSAIFPDGIIIGEVISFQKIPGENFYKIKILFFEDLNRIHYVYVAESLMRQEKELLELNAKDD